MQTACYKLLIVAIVASGVVNCAARVQDRQSAESKSTADQSTATRVTLGDSSATPGTMTMIPIYFTPQEGAALGSLKMEVNFVSVNLKFDKLQPGLAAENNEVELSSDSSTGKNDLGVETSTVTVKVNVSPSKSNSRGIPAGLLAYMTFRVSETGRLAKISLQLKAEGEELKSKKALQGIQATGSQIEVVAPDSQPAVACFFFTH
jgi:hypothetical protein